MKIINIREISQSWDYPYKKGYGSKVIWVLVPSSVGNRGPNPRFSPAPPRIFGDRAGTGMILWKKLGTFRGRGWLQFWGFLGFYPPKTPILSLTLSSKNPQNFPSAHPRPRPVPEISGRGRGKPGIGALTPHTNIDLRGWWCKDACLHIHRRTDRCEVWNSYFKNINLTSMW